MDFVIAVDGPAASGKGTVASRLAALYGLPYLDTGLLYRAVGVGVLARGGDPDDAALAEAEARALVIHAIDETAVRTGARPPAASPPTPACARPWPGSSVTLPSSRAGRCSTGAT
jgi:cytidylate kinase